MLLPKYNLTPNVPPSITDPEELRATQIERQKVFVQ